MLLTVKSRLTGETQSKDAIRDVIVLEAPSDVFLDVDSSAIVSRTMRGDDLILKMEDGTEIVIKNFSVVDGSGAESRLVLSDGEIQTPDIGIGATSGLLLAGGASLAAGLSGFGGTSSYDTTTPPVDPTPDPTPTIDLSGTVFGGQLINPVTVDGRTYYYWDRDGSGDAGESDQEKHDELDRLFNNGNDTTSTNNSFTLPDGTVLRLPEIGEPDHEEGTFEGLHEYPSQFEDNNPDYTGLLSVWDAHNQAGEPHSEAVRNGVPDGWMPGNYWTSSSTSSEDAALQKHAMLSLSGGDSLSQSDWYSRYVAIEVV